MADFNLQTALKAVAARRTDIQMQEQEARNVAGRGRLDPNSAGERIARARQNEQQLLDQLEWLQQEPDSDLKTQRIGQMMDRLGELAAEQGDYDQAATISRSQERRQYYQTIADAIPRPDDETCDCGADLVVDRKNMQEFQSPAIMVVDQIVSPDGTLLNLDRCRKCHFVNTH